MTTRNDELSAALKDQAAKEAAGLIIDSEEFLKLAGGAAERLLGVGRCFATEYYFYGGENKKTMGLCATRMAEAMEAMQKLDATIRAAREEAAAPETTTA
jgi:hypothetical protein